MEQITEQLCDQCKNHMANAKNQNKGTMLHFTIRSKHDNCMEVLLKTGADVNSADGSNYNFTPLMTAAWVNYVHGVQRLIQAGAGVNRRSKDNKTSLILAGAEGHDKCVELLLNAGADVNVLTSGEYMHVTALHAAVTCIHISMGPDVNRSDENEMVPIETRLEQVRREGVYRCIELLLNAGADVNALTGGPPGQFTALVCAVDRAHITHVKLLLMAGAEVNKEGYDSCHDKGVTALCSAARIGFDETIKVLIQAGADVNKVPKNGITPLMDSIHVNAFDYIEYDDDPFTEETYKHRKCMELLLEAGADVNAECCDYTALLVALEYGLHGAVNLLIQAGADVNKVRKNGITPLMAALQSDGFVNYIVKCLELLIQAGSDVNAMAPDGSALIIASQNAFDEGVQILIQAGADVHLVNSDGNTALMAVSIGTPIVLTDDCEMDRFSCLKRLLCSAAKINTRNSRSENALQCLVRAYYGTKANNSMSRFLFAAGETLDGIPDEEIPDCLKFNDVKLELKHICREAIRKHLLKLDPHTHLFGRVPRLGLPSLLTEYLLYNMSFDDDIDDNSNGDSEIDDGNNEVKD